MDREIRIITGADALAKRAAQEFVQAATSAVLENGSFSVALSGGSTPKALYSLLVTDEAIRAQLPWDKMQIFFGDERNVGPNHSDSNFRMAAESLLSKVPLKPDQVHRIKGEYTDADKAAREYEQDIRASFQLGSGEFPRFDLILLGLGNDGHTASLFPGTTALHEKQRLVVSNWVGKLLTHRVTLTAPAINHAGRVMFLVAGADKASALKAVLEGAREPDQLPAQLIEPPKGKLLWLADDTAAGLLSAGIRE
jgi:6-phosphogluconolactonase